MKKILILLLAAVMMLSTFACTKNSGKKPADTDPAVTTTEKETYVSSSVDDPDEPDGLLIANEGTSKYVIVHGANASAAEATAATELQKYLKQITNVELPVVTDAVAETKYEIVVGKTNREQEGDFDRDEFGIDGFVIKVIDKKLYLVGSEVRGTLYSVYGFLEEYLGCRYYTADFEKIPTMSTILLDENMPEDKQIPVLSFRSVYGNYGAVFNAKLRLKSLQFYGNYGDLNETLLNDNFGGTSKICISHNLYPLMKPYTDGYYAVNYEQNADMFAGPDHSQPCFTNPKVIEVITENARQQLRQNPDWEMFSLGLEDNYDFCTCDGCIQALDEEQGKKSGVYMRFVNAIAGALKDEFPNVLFSAFAYNHVTEPPVVTKAAENVVIVYTTMGGCFSHPVSEDYINGCVPHALIDNWTEPRHGEYLKGWDAMCDTIFVWNYATNFHNYDAFFPNFEVMNDNIKFFAECGSIGVFEQICNVNSVDFKELRLYLISKLLWDPYMSEEEYYAHMNDFLEGYYGPGWESLRDYIDFTQDKVSDLCYCMYEHFEMETLYYNVTPEEVNPKGSCPSDLTADMIRNYEQTDWTKYLNWYTDLTDNEYFVKGYEYFAKALAAAETDDQRYRIERTSIQVDYIMSSYKSLQLKYGKSAFSKILAAFFEANPGVFTADEQSSLKSAINTFARAQAEAAYAEYNRALRDKLSNYGITMVREINGDIKNPDILNYTLPPCSWIKESI